MHGGTYLVFLEGKEGATAEEEEEGGGSVLMRPSSSHELRR